MKTERGLALQDLIGGAYEYIESVELPPNARVYLLDYLATTEYVLDHFFDVSLLTHLDLQTSSVHRGKREAATECIVRSVQECSRIGSCEGVM